MMDRCLACEAEAEHVISNQIEEMTIRRKIKQVRNFLSGACVVKMVRLALWEARLASP
jgi:hypothetical protein